MQARPNLLPPDALVQVDADLVVDGLGDVVDGVPGDDVCRGAQTDAACSPLRLPLAHAVHPRAPHACSMPGHASPARDGRDACCTAVAGAAAAEKPVRAQCTLRDPVCFSGVIWMLHTPCGKGPWPQTRSLHVHRPEGQRLGQLGAWLARLPRGPHAMHAAAHGPGTARNRKRGEVCVHTPPCTLADLRAWPTTHLSGRSPQLRGAPCVAGPGTSPLPSSLRIGKCLHPGLM